MKFSFQIAALMPFISFLLGLLASEAPRCCGYLLSYSESRTIAVEIALQNGSVAVAVMTNAFGSQPQVYAEMMTFPLFHFIFQVGESILLVLTVQYLKRKGFIEENEVGKPQEESARSGNNSNSFFKAAKLKGTNFKSVFENGTQTVTDCFAASVNKLCGSKGSYDIRDEESSTQSNVEVIETNTASIKPLMPDQKRTSRYNSREERLTDAKRDSRKQHRNRSTKRSSRHDEHLSSRRKKSFDNPSKVDRGSQLRPTDDHRTRRRSEKVTDRRSDQRSTESHSKRKSQISRKNRNYHSRPNTNGLSV